MFEFLCLLLPSVLSIISPVLTANIISSITVYDFESGKKFLIYDFAIIIISAISYFCYHLFSTKVNRTIVTNFQNYVDSSVKENQNINQISLSVLNDIYSSTDFNKNLLYKICFLIKSVVILIIIITHNLFIALAIFAVSIITFFLLNLTDKKIQKHNYNFSIYQNQSIDLFNSIQEGAKNENNETVSNTLKTKYFNLVDKSIKTNNKISLLYNINNNFISLILKTTIFLSTLFLITQIKLTTLTLSLYLILTPYLTSSAQNLISFFEIFSEFGTVENALSNFKSLSEKNQPLQNEDVEIKHFNLNFFEVSSNTSLEPKLFNINLKFEFQKMHIIFGESGSGIETIYSLLTRKLKTTSGGIFIDNHNIENFSNTTFSKFFSFTNTTPHFYNISILENLELVCKNKSRITKTISDWNLKSEINKLENNLNEIITKSTSEKLLYFLGLLKCFLSDSKIICVFGIPNNLNKEELNLLKNIFLKIKKQRLLLLFSNDSRCFSIADNIHFIEKGKITINKETK